MQRKASLCTEKKLGKIRIGQDGEKIHSFLSNFITTQEIDNEQKTSTFTSYQVY